jgi:uncharacterized protein YndB with AHSA1/START domain
MTSTRIVGSLRRADDGKGVVRMEDRYDTDIDDLWSALTDPHRLARWIAEVDGDLRLGGRIHARFTSSWEGPGRIDVCEVPHHLSVTLSPGASDETVIDAVLVAERTGRTWSSRSAASQSPSSPATEPAGRHTWKTWPPTSPAARPETGAPGGPP